MDRYDISRRDSRSAGAKPSTPIGKFYLQCWQIEPNLWLVTQTARKLSWSSIWVLFLMARWVGTLSMLLIALTARSNRECSRGLLATCCGAALGRIVQREILLLVWQPEVGIQVMQQRQPLQPTPEGCGSGRPTSEHRYKRIWRGT